LFIPLPIVIIIFAAMIAPNTAQRDGFATPAVVLNLVQDLVFKLDY